MQKAFTETLVPCVRINGLPLFAKLELGSLGGFAFFVGFPNGFLPFFCAFQFSLCETLIGAKKREANERPILAEKRKLFFCRGIKTPTRVLKPKNTCFFPTPLLQILLLKSNLRVKFGALRGQKNALRAPQLPAGCNVEHFSQNGFRTVLARLWARWQ